MYKDWKVKTAKAFLEIRKERHFIINNVFMMVDANIPNLPVETSRNILMELNKRFLFEMED